ncbi:MAG: hypothetical protein LH609_17395 [Rudanella sp.]|nr:hypothetical protein [Rudanella sp.]
MRGINYMTDDKGIRTAVVIDLKTYGEEIEDFLDGIEAESRKDEPKEEATIVFERILEAKLADD